MIKMMCRVCGKEMSMPLTPEQIRKLESLPWWKEFEEIKLTPAEEAEIDRTFCSGH
jgi:hypothetical protein